MRLKDTKIYNLYWKSIGWRLKYLKNSITNLIRWFPVIWKDRDYDDYYIFEVLKFKLTNQAKYISKRDYHTRAQYDAEKMRLCVRLIEKVCEEYYNMEYMDYFEIKRHFTECIDRPGSYEMGSEYISESFNDYINKYPLIYKRVLNGEGWLDISSCDEIERKERIAMNIGHINHIRARKLLFKLLDTHIEGWWD